MKIRELDESSLISIYILFIGKYNSNSYSNMTLNNNIVPSYTASYIMTLNNTSP